MIRLDVLLLLLSISIVNAINGGCCKDPEECECEYVAENATTQIEQWIDFSTSPLIIGSSPQSYSVLGCPCFTSGADTSAAASPESVSAPGGFFASRSDEGGGLLISNKMFSVPQRGEIQLSAGMRFFDGVAHNGNVCVENTCGLRSRVPGHVQAARRQQQAEWDAKQAVALLIGQDPFFGSGKLVAWDTTTGLMFGFVLTNYRGYALYGRNPPYANPLGIDADPTFTYLVPVQARFPSTIADYSIVMNRAAGWVSWRINEQERLLLDAIGRPIDPRFALYNGTAPAANACPLLDLPDTFQVVVGNDRFPRQPSAQVCQGALFSQCTQSIYNATGTHCDYPKPPSELFTSFDYDAVVVEMKTTVYSLAVVSWTDAFDCREQGCRYDCRRKACPFKHYEECPSSESVSSSSSEEPLPLSSSTTCPISSSSSEVPPEPSESSADTCQLYACSSSSSSSSESKSASSSAQPSPPIDCRERGTTFEFQSEWDLHFHF